MVKKLLKFIFGALVLLIIATFFLVQGSVKSSEQLKNVAAPATIFEVVDLSKLNYDFSGNGLATELSLDNKQFNQILKLSAEGQDASAQDMVFSLEKDKVRIQSPVKVGFLDSKADVYAVPRINGNDLEFEVDSVRLGNLPLPKSLLLTQIKSQLAESGGSNISLEGDKIKVPLAVPYVKMKQIDVKDGKLAVKLSLDSSFLSNLNSLIGQQ